MIKKQAIGNLTKEPIKLNNAIVFTVAINLSDDKAIFEDCILFGKRSERYENLKKGERLYVEGKVELKEFTTKENILVKKEQIIIDAIERIKTTTQQKEKMPF